MSQETAPEEKGSLLVLIISVLIFALPVFVLVTGLMHINRIGNRAKEYIGDFTPDLSNLSDGKYRGSYKISDSKTVAAIEFTVNAHTVSSLSVQKLYHTPLYPPAKKIKAHIEQNPDLHFDAISGATKSSVLLNAAIKSALESGTVL